MTTAVFGLLLVVASLRGSLALSIHITPEDKLLQTREDSLTVRCVVDEPITHCQIRVAEYDGTQKSVAYLDRGHESSAGHFKYEGDGLAAGHCGATIEPAALPKWPFYGTVQCRVRNSKSDWVYSAMTVRRHTTGTDEIPLTIESRLVVAQLGKKLQLLAQAEEPLRRCEVKRPRRGWMNLIPGFTCGTKADSSCYQGRGLTLGDCGVAINNITGKSNGMYWFQVDTSSTGKIFHVQVIVTKPPSTPVLSSNTTLMADGTKTLTAVCTVVGSRPAANITWVLDEEVVTGGKIDYVSSNTWVNQYDDQTTIQKLTLIIDDTMQGKDLSCIANHVALASPISSNKVTIV